MVIGRWSILGFDPEPILKFQGLSDGDFGTLDSLRTSGVVMGLTEQHSEYAALSDPELVEASLTDLDAFGELIRRHQDFVYGAALRIVRNPVMAQDLAQEAFVRAHKALPGFRGQAQVRSWLYRIATNLALNAVQRRKEYPSETLPDRPAKYDPASDAVNQAMRKDIEEAISELPDKLKEPLVLREYEGMSYQDIADRLDMPLNTVRTRILRARRALRDRLEAWR
jgi:RNA polymerase sigma-70 factor (ECF subfamily)